MRLYENCPLTGAFFYELKCTFVQMCILIDNQSSEYEHVMFFSAAL